MCVSPAKKRTLDPPAHKLVNIATTLFRVTAHVVCLKSKCTYILFKHLLYSPEITSYLFQSMTLGNGSNVFPTDYSSNGSHFL
jgi:hypothetical protein